MHFTWPYLWLYFLCITITCTYSVLKVLYLCSSPLTPAPHVRQSQVKQFFFGDLRLNANSKGSFRNSWAVPVPGGFSSAQASGLIQDSYYWNGSLHPVFQKRNPLQTPMPQSSPPHRARCQAGKLIKTIAAGTECTRTTWTRIRHFPWKGWCETKHSAGKGKPCEWEPSS